MDPRLRRDRYRRLSDIAKSYGLRLVYLFGSQADLGFEYLEGGCPELADPLADLDIGVVLLNEDLETMERAELYGSLSMELQELFSPFSVDLVMLGETHSVLQAEAICGRCVYSESDDERERYEERILAKAADFKTVLDLFHRERLEERHDKPSSS